MTIREILNTTDHRPWAVPNESWKFYQEWNHSIFLHWQVELSELQKFVPKEFEIGKAVTQKNDLDKWLTERCALYQDSGNSMNEFEIHHAEWAIHEVDLKKVEVNYPRFGTLIKTKPHKIQYSNGVKVIAWGKNKKARTESKK